MASERFGPYRIEGMIGRGSMGEVHRATDLRKERTVALKRLSVAHSGDEGFATRFRREAEMTARLHEPHVIPIHDYGEIDGQLYLDMRLVEGIDLSGAIAASGPLDPHRAVAVVEQVAAALDAAHRAALIHRDVKPSNILLAQPEGSGPEFAYLIDFGIAASLRDSRLTEQSTLIGTAAYMAPERFMPGAGGDHRVDVYALGCVLHETLVGKQPFPSGSIHQLMHAHVHEPAPRPGSLRAGLPQALDEVVAIAMAKDPDQRYQRAGELAAAARAAISGAGAVVPGSPSSPTIPGAGGPGAAGSAARPAGRTRPTSSRARPSRARSRARSPGRPRARRRRHRPRRRPGAPGCGWSPRCCWRWSCSAARPTCSPGTTYPAGRPPLPARPPPGCPTASSGRGTAPRTSPPRDATSGSAST